MDAIHGHACFDDLDLDARSQWVGKCVKTSVVCSRQQIKQAINIKLATTVGHFYVSMTLQTVIWLDQLVSFSFLFFWQEEESIVRRLTHYLFLNSRSEGHYKSGALSEQPVVYNCNPPPPTPLLR